MASSKFLDLPAELRLMVYERLNSRTHHYCVKQPDENPVQQPREKASEDIRGAVIIKSFPVAILATCRVIHKEATPILAGKLQQLAQTPVRIIMSFATFTQGFNGPTKEVRFTVLKPYSTICKSFFARAAIPRVSGNAAFEVALTTSNTLPSGKHLLVALLMSWSKVQRSNIPVNVFCQGPLPLYNHGQDVVATWASVTAYKLAQWDASGEVQHSNLMDVKHMSEEDWKKLGADWEAW
jgi:hypothetical protein